MCEVEQDSLGGHGGGNSSNPCCGLLQECGDKEANEGQEHDKEEKKLRTDNPAAIHHQHHQLLPLPQRQLVARLPRVDLRRYAYAQRARSFATRRAPFVPASVGGHSQLEDGQAPPPPFKVDMASLAAAADASTPSCGEAARRSVADVVAGDQLLAHQTHSAGTASPTPATGRPPVGTGAALGPPPVAQELDADHADVVAPADLPIKHEAAEEEQQQQQQRHTAVSSYDASCEAGVKREGAVKEEEDVLAGDTPLCYEEPRVCSLPSSLYLSLSLAHTTRALRPCSLPPSFTGRIITRLYIEKAGDVIRGRVWDEDKPSTFNKLWTPDEQRRLEQLLLEIPDEDVAAHRWSKIARALGNRTPRQVLHRPAVPPSLPPLSLPSLPTSPTRCAGFVLSRRPQGGLDDWSRGPCSVMPLMLGGALTSLAGGVTGAKVLHQAGPSGPSRAWQTPQSRRVPSQAPKDVPPANPS